MKFFNTVFVVTALLATGVWLHWKTPSEIIRLEETSPPLAELETVELSPELWNKLVFEAETTPEEGDPASAFMEVQPSVPIRKGTTVEVRRDDNLRYFATELLAPKWIWREEDIPARKKFPLRPFAYLFLAAAILVVVFRRSIFRAEKSPVVSTSVGTGYRISQAALLSGAFLLLLPFTYRIETNLMGASGFLGAILFLTGLICFLLYSRSASKLEKILQDPNSEVLADWTIPKEEWLLFLKQNLSKEKKALLIIMTLITVFAFFSAFIVSHGEKNAWMVMLAIGAIFGVLWSVTVLPTFWKRRRLLRGRETVRVYPFGVAIGNRFQLWQEPNCSFSRAIYVKEPVSQISVSCGSAVLTEGGVVPLQRQIVFPVPRAEMESAEQIVEHLNDLNSKPADSSQGKESAAR